MKIMIDIKTDYVHSLVYVHTYFGKINKKTLYRIHTYTNYSPFNMWNNIYNNL